VKARLKCLTNALDERHFVGVVRVDGVLDFTDRQLRILRYEELEIGVLLR
jgi:hypothetical protein